MHLSLGGKMVSKALRLVMCSKDKTAVFTQQRTQPQLLRVMLNLSATWCVVSLSFDIINK